MKKIKVLNVQFDVCPLNEALTRVAQLFSERRDESVKQIVTPNPEMLLEAQKNEPFRTVLNRSWLSIPDGIGILWASSLSGKVSRIKALISLLGIMLRPSSCKSIFPERLTGVDFMDALCKESRRFGAKIYLLGAGPGVALRTKEALHKKYPGIVVVGAECDDPTVENTPRIIENINRASPDFLFVAYGAPKQELWIADNLKAFRGLKIVMGVGGAFDFIAGTKKRAPRWMRSLGLEWLFRLIQEPKRIKRIWNAVVVFPKVVLKSK